LIELIPEFITGIKAMKILLVKGFAGTGKTTILGALVKTLNILKASVVLLAPTGRAAKVLSSYCSHGSYTIHKKIYRQKSLSDGTGRFVLDRNLHKNTVFIVDEASMIANQSFDADIFGSGRLLDDLISYVDNGRNCKLMLVGDTAQLPPVGLDISPALDMEYIKGFGFNVREVFLKEILRQAEDSGILFNASGIRHLINDSINELPHFILEGFDDVERVDGSDLIEKITESYDKYGTEGTIIITRSNKKANQFNKGNKGKYSLPGRGTGTGRPA
jgi:exodeoxyribonuclease V